LNCSDWNPIPRLWDGETVICVASGPSITDEDRETILDTRRKVIVVNRMWYSFRFADLLYAADGRWWKSSEAPQVGEFPGLRVTGSRDVAGSHRVSIRHRQIYDDPAFISNGTNSGFQAMCLAVHLGASRVCLVGYTMGLGQGGEVHSHEDHVGLHNPGKSDFGRWLAAFAHAAPVLKAMGIQVVNCSPSALTCFERRPLAECIP